MNKIPAFIKRISKTMKTRSYTAFSSQAAFFTFISLMPFMALVFCVTKSINFDITEEYGKIRDFLPEILKSVIREAYENADKYSAGTIIPSAFLLTLFSASKGIFAISVGVTEIMGTSPAAGWKLRLKSLAYTALLLISLISVLALVIFGDFALDIFSVKSGIADKLLRVFLCFGLVFAIHIFVYRCLPREKCGIKYAVFGAVVSSVIWIVLSVGYGIYINGRFSSKTDIYGSLASAVVLLLWLYACMKSVLLGAAVAAEASYGEKSTK